MTDQLIQQKWTQKEISDWADDTFGRVSTWESLSDRADDEQWEFCEASIALDKSDAGSFGRSEALETKLVEEAADIMIVLMRVFEYHGVHFQDVIDKKMYTNRYERKWKKFGNGHGRHE